MKKYRTKPWAKGLACGLFVLAMTVSVICLGNVRWLVNHGGYQWEGTQQLVEEEEAFWVENLTNQLADGYRAYRDGDQSLDVKRYVEDENFRTAQAALQIACDLVDEGMITEQEAVLRVEPKQLDTLLHPQFDAAALKAA